MKPSRNFTKKANANEFVGTRKQPFTAKALCLTARTVIAGFCQPVLASSRG